MQLAPTLRLALELAADNCGQYPVVPAFIRLKLLVPKPGFCPELGTENASALLPRFSRVTFCVAPAAEKVNGAAARWLLTATPAASITSTVSRASPAAMPRSAA